MITCSAKIYRSRKFPSFQKINKKLLLIRYISEYYFKFIHYKTALIIFELLSTYKHLISNEKSGILSLSITLLAFLLTLTAKKYNKLIINNKALKTGESCPPVFSAL